MKERSLPAASAAAALLGPVLLSAAFASGAGAEAVLPPEPAWSGESRSLVLPADHPWVTPSERSGLTRTPRYDETVEWLRRLVDAAPELGMVSLGRTPEGRDLWMVIASGDRTFSADDLRRGGRPTLFVLAGIHAGEIDGKDAGMMLLRDLTVTGRLRGLLDRANLLFVPIFNPDGHERLSLHSRMNQRGPVEAGWRATARRLNLNRDWSKLDTPEMRAVVAALNRYDPDLLLDLHVTDGLDYRYDITYGFQGTHSYSPAISGWLGRHLQPAWDRDLAAMGHAPGPLIFPRSWGDFDGGLAAWTSGPRFSDGYATARHLPAVLVENHSLKSYDRRVLGTYVLLESSMRLLGREGKSLRAAIEADRRRRSRQVVLDWDYPERTGERLAFDGIGSRLVPSAAAGRPVRQWTGEPVDLVLPLWRKNHPRVEVRRPAAYWIPPAWTDVIERLEWHGVEMERIDSAREAELEWYRIEEPKLERDPFEGRARVEASFRAVRARRRLPAGSVRVSTDQVLGDLAVLLLEPASPDSFFRWGFFLEALQRVEYAEEYVLAPMADRMLEDDPRLRSEFEKRLAGDPEFAADPKARLEWFYERTPFHDPGYLLYPVAREP